VSFHATLQGRELVLTGEGGPLLSLPLDQGGRYRLVAPDGPTIEQVLHALEAVPGVAVLPAEGGLLGAMTVSANLSLALRYGVEADEAMLRDWEQALQMAFRLCGLSEDRIRHIGREQPMHLDRIERWLIGYARYLLRPSELLVLDRIFSGLSRRQAEAVIALESVYHEFHPFRPTLFVDLDTHGLPEIADCRTTFELEAAVCPS
jgi:ABC-type branched-subunit amino acid transport system ATPase component